MTSIYYRSAKQGPIRPRSTSILNNVKYNEQCQIGKLRTPIQWKVGMKSSLELAVKALLDGFEKMFARIVGPTVFQISQFFLKI